MIENQIKRPPQDVPLTTVFHTILAAENKTSELFVKSFHYQGENITTKHLGQIFGFFEIPDTQEDNAYIVNFLASVVKKEYFINPKRSATDSFEAALHKVNLALTELVKQGNTGWLGKLNGVVSVIENNRFHFSVTGDASILLYRDQQVSLISEGLADKDAALHPLKTFLEISSGALLPNDKILITSPELFTLCHPETLRKNAFRMDKNGFARFVRAALVNELPLGVSTIIDLEPAPAPVRPKKKAAILREESREKLQNVFSSAPFVETEPKEESKYVIQEEKTILPTEYTDQKTGHIYVQGESHYGTYREPSSWQRFMDEYIRPLVEALSVSLKRLTKKSRKALTKNAAVMSAKGSELSRNLWQLSREKSAHLATKSNETLKSKIEAIKARRMQKEAFLESEKFLEVEETPQESEEVYPSLPVPDALESEPFPISVESPTDFSEEPPLTTRQRALQRFSPEYQAQKNALPDASPSFSLSVLGDIVRSFSSSLGKKFTSLSKKQISAIVVLLLVVIVGVITLKSDFTLFSQSSEEKPPVSENTPVNPVQEPSPKPQLANATERASWEEGNGILVVTTDESTVVVTPKSIIFNNKVLPFVANGSIESAAHMPDLRMIFLWSSANELVSWSLVDQKFTANIFPIPANVDASGLGAYLTYLYALDKNAGTIYRFARIEGGFSEPTTWLKTSLPKGSVQDFAVNDTIRIAGTTTDQYLRGVKEKTLSESAYQVLDASSNRTFTLGLETGTGKLTIWNADGNVVHEGTYPELSGASAMAYNETSKKLLVAKERKLTEYSLSW